MKSGPRPRRFDVYGSGPRPGRMDGALAQIVNRLRLAAGATVPTAELIDIIYDDDEDGGPEYAAHIIGVLASRLRVLGFPIEGRRGRCAGGYRYVPSFREVV